MAATTVFLFTDIAGSTRLWDEQPEAMKEALAAHDELVAEIVESHGGRVFKHTGDGSVSAFSSARSALAAAAGMQRQLQAEEFDEIGTLRVRMAVHAGEAVEREGDYFGPALNRTARLMAVAHPGQVLVSLVAARLAEASPQELQDLGEHRLPDLGQPERIFQLLADGLTHDFPPIRSLQDRPHNLPVLTTSFVGRDQELAELVKLVRGSRLVTVTGVGGAGKTRLVLQAAADLLPQQRDGAWLVELAPVTEPEAIDAAVVSALGLSQTGEQSLREAVLEHLSRRAALLLVDNCEHLLDASADLVSSLLAAAPDLRVIATSRELLGVPGEVTYGLRSMRVPGRESSAEELARSDAVRLFVERGSAARPDFRLAADNVGHVAEICRRLDGMPLAIELAAARLRSFSPSHIAELLDQRFRLLTGGSRTALPRQQTLTAAIEWSYRLLEEWERVLFRRLAVFLGGFTLEAAQQVAAGHPLDPLDVLELLPHLVDKSLVVAETGETDTRYRLLETIRQFARERLDETGEGEEVWLRHARFYRDLAVEARRSFGQSEEQQWQRRMALEMDNLRQALAWSAGAGELELAAELAALFGQLSYRAGRWQEALGWAKQLADEAEAAAIDPRVQAQLSYSLAGLLYNKGDLEGAIGPMQRAVDHFRAEAEGEADAETLHWLSRSLNNLGIVLLYSGRGGERNEVYTELVSESLAASRRAGDAYGIALALANLAHHRDPEGDPEEARALFAEAEEATRRSGSRERLAGLATQRAHFEFNQGCFTEAAEAWRTSIELGEAEGLTAEVRTSRVELAACEAELGDEGAPERFVEATRRLLEAPEERASNRLHPTLLAFRAGIEARRGRFEQVARAAGAAKALGGQGVPVRWDLVEHLSRAEGSAREALGEEHYERLFAEGEGMSHDQVVELLTSD